MNWLLQLATIACQIPLALNTYSLSAESGFLAGPEGLVHRKEHVGRISCLGSLACIILGIFTIFVSDHVLAPLFSLIGGLLFWYSQLHCAPFSFTISDICATILHFGAIFTLLDYRHSSVFLYSSSITCLGYFGMQMATHELSYEHSVILSVGPRLPCELTVAGRLLLSEKTGADGMVGKSQNFLSGRVHAYHCLLSLTLAVLPILAMISLPLASIVVLSVSSVVFALYFMCCELGVAPLSMLVSTFVICLTLFCREQMNMPKFTVFGRLLILLGYYVIKFSTKYHTSPNPSMVHQIGNMLCTRHLLYPPFAPESELLIDALVATPPPPPSTAPSCTPPEPPQSWHRIHRPKLHHCSLYSTRIPMALNLAAHQPFAAAAPLGSWVTRLPLVILGAESSVFWIQYGMKQELYQHQIIGARIQRATRVHTGVASTVAPWSRSITLELPLETSPANVRIVEALGPVFGRLGNSCEPGRITRGVPSLEYMWEWCRHIIVRGEPLKPWVYESRPKDQIGVPDVAPLVSLDDPKPNVMKVDPQFVYYGTDGEPETGHPPDDIPVHSEPSSVQQTATTVSPIYTVFPMPYHPPMQAMVSNQTTVTPKTKIPGAYDAVCIHSSCPDSSVRRCSSLKKSEVAHSPQPCAQALRGKWNQWWTKIFHRKKPVEEHTVQAPVSEEGNNELNSEDDCKCSASTPVTCDLDDRVCNPCKTDCVSFVRYPPGVRPPGCLPPSPKTPPRELPRTPCGGHLGCRQPYHDDLVDIPGTAVSAELWNIRHHVPMPSNKRTIEEVMGRPHPEDAPNSDPATFTVPRDQKDRAHEVYQQRLVPSTSECAALTSLLDAWTNQTAAGLVETLGTTA